MEKATSSSWSKVYSIGHKDIDNEHKTIFILSDKLIYKLDNINTIKETLQKIIHYTKTHFYNEEKYMQKINYPELQYHKKEHQKMIQHLSEFIKNIHSYNRQDIKEALFEFIQTHFITHILNKDKKFHHFRRPLHELKEIFIWNDLYKVGDEAIDKEHQKLFSIAFKALDMSIKEKSQSNFKVTIKELYDYMQYHFKNEEAYMKRINFKYYTYHQKLHYNIINEIHHFIKSIPTLNKEKIDRKLIEYMDIWLVSHIVSEDKRITQFNG